MLFYYLYIRLVVLSLGMPFIRKIKWVIVALLLIVIASWLYNRYDDKAFLRYGILKIDKYPESMQMLDYKTEGASDFHAKYNITIDSIDLDKLLIGRKYIKEDAHTATNLAMPYEEPHDFNPKYRYHSGTIGNGITVIYVNADNTKVFIDYWFD